MLFKIVINETTKINKQISQKQKNIRYDSHYKVA